MIYFLQAWSVGAMDISKRDKHGSAQNNAVELVCMIKKYFPPSMLTTQVHLLVHVVDDAKMASNVCTLLMDFSFGSFYEDAKRICLPKISFER